MLVVCQITVMMRIHTLRMNYEQPEDVKGAEKIGVYDEMTLRICPPVRRLAGEFSYVIQVCQISNRDEVL